MLLPDKRGGIGVSRLQWVDVARGIGIILVVYGHALRAQVTSGQFDPRWNAVAQDTVIYAFHMHLFFFLAGLFVAGSVEKGVKPFLTEKAATIAYPYILWSSVSIMLGAAASGATNYAVNTGQILSIWYTPVYQFWFLYVLFICNIAALLIRASRKAAVLLVLASCAGLGTVLPGMISVSTIYFPFFFGGLLLRPKLVESTVSQSAAVAAVGIGSVGLFIVFWQSNLIAVVMPDQLTSLLRGALGVAAVIGAAVLLQGRAAWLALLGTASMAIYVLHTIFSAGLRIAMMALGLGPPIVSLVLCTIIGIAAPLVIWMVVRHYGALRWLALGTDIRRKMASTA